MMPVMAAAPGMEEPRGMEPSLRPHNGAATPERPAAAGPRVDLELARRTFAAEGYVVCKGVVPPELLAPLHEGILGEFDRAQRAGQLFSGGGLLAGHLNCFPGELSRRVYDTLVSRGVVELVQTLVAPAALRLPNVGCNLNLPGSVTQHYHMDRPYTQAFMIANVALVDTDIANGAIDVLPGTHKQFYPFWRFAAERVYRGTTRLPLRRGDVLVRTSSLWHRGMPNHTAVARPMLAFTWEDGGSTQPDPFRGEGGRIAFRPNWYRPNLLGRLRERAYVAAPITYEAYRFVRSFFGKKGYDN
jgi:hypothetical protein